MRISTGLVTLVLLGAPAVARGELILQGSAGPTLIDRGYSLSAGVGTAVSSHVELLLEIDRTHLSSRVRSDAFGGSTFRGGTLTLAAPQVRVGLFGPNRVGPYGVVGFGAGISRPTVNDRFPDPVTNAVRALFFGGGIRIPLSQAVKLFADVRGMVGAEAGELVALTPIRAGLAWYF